MIIVEGHVRLAKAENVQRLLTAAAVQIKFSKAESGCIDYTYGVDVLDPAVIRVCERWESWEALEAHFKEPHMVPWRAALKDAEIIERDLRAHEVSETRDV